MRAGSPMASRATLASRRWMAECSERVATLMFLDPLGIAIRDEIQPDVVLEERLEAREHQREALRRVGHLLHELVSAAREAGMRDPDERGAILLRQERPLHHRRTV